MRATRARQAAVLLGIGLGAFLEGILLHPLAGFFYMLAWALTLAGVILLWSAVRGPGPLPSSRSVAGMFAIGWGAFEIVEAVSRHDLRADWLLAAAGVALVLLGFALARLREEHLVERRSGFDRRSASPLR